MIPPLCIIQARYGSTRLPGKMLLTLPHLYWRRDDKPNPDRPVIGRMTYWEEETLIARAWRLACEAFGVRNVMVALPQSDYIGKDGDPNDAPLGIELDRIMANIFPWDGPENDVLSRFYHCAHRYRWHPDSVIHRWTPDDPFKDPVLCRRVAAGERHPVELGGEAFTLAMLDAAQELEPPIGAPGIFPLGWNREHITHALFPTTPPPPPPPGVWTIDTQADLDAARERLAREREL